ncbi:hypothetical protein CYMTET_50004, partial [Cymbomonas tetramitiformis]
ALQEFPILPALLKAAPEHLAQPQAGTHLPPPQLELNEDQAVVSSAVQAWASETVETASGDGHPAEGKLPPLYLVHGPFGCGKTHLVVNIITQLAARLHAQGDCGTRIMVSAYTNTAVDRVLLGLLAAGFTDFLRVGRLQKIDPRVLPYSVHCSETSSRDKGDQSVAELNRILRDCSSKEQRATVQRELQQAKAGQLRQRQQRLQSVRVVGVTCLSSVNPLLDGHSFPIVILDECYQMIEPASLLPLARAGCRHLVAVGDPMQLPPLLSQPSGHGQKGRPAQQAPSNLGRPLFGRLAAAGFRPLFLRTQYRCHPMLSRIPNECFYEGRLLDGCTPQDRASLAGDLSALTFCDVREGRAQYDQGGSQSNQVEAQVVGKLVCKFLARGVSGANIGVITFFCSQERLIRRELERACAASDEANQPSPDGPEDEAMEGGLDGSAVQIATVDSFQGAEKEIIILSICNSRSINFCASPGRLNVALTRARRHLICLGNAIDLQSQASGESVWAHLLRMSRKTSRSYLPPRELLRLLDAGSTHLQPEEAQRSASEPEPVLHDPPEPEDVLEEVDQERPPPEAPPRQAPPTPYELALLDEMEQEHERATEDEAGPALAVHCPSPDLVVLDALPQKWPVARTWATATDKTPAAGDTAAESVEPAAGDTTPVEAGDGRSASVAAGGLCHDGSRLSLNLQDSSREASEQATPECTESPSGAWSAPLCTPPEAAASGMSSGRMSNGAEAVAADCLTPQPDSCARHAVVDVEMDDEAEELQEGETDGELENVDSGKEDMDVTLAIPSNDVVAAQSIEPSQGTPKYRRDNPLIAPYICPEDLEAHLDELGFSPQDLWQGYKWYCCGSHYNQPHAREQFSYSKMAAAFRQACRLEEQLRWDQALEKHFKKTYPLIEAYVAVHFDPRCAKLRWLIRHYDDAASLATTPFGLHTLVHALPTAAAWGASCLLCGLYPPQCAPCIMHDAENEEHDDEHAAFLFRDTHQDCGRSSEQTAKPGMHGETTCNGQERTQAVGNRESPGGLDSEERGGSRSAASLDEWPASARCSPREPPHELDGEEAAAAPAGVDGKRSLQEGAEGDCARGSVASWPSERDVGDEEVQGAERGEDLTSAWHGEVPGQAGSAQRSTVAAASSKTIMEDWDTVGRCSDEHGEALASAWHGEVPGQPGARRSATDTGGRRGGGLGDGNMVRGSRGAQHDERATRCTTRAERCGTQPGVALQSAVAAVAGRTAVHTMGDEDIDGGERNDIRMLTRHEEASGKGGAKRDSAEAAGSGKDVMDEWDSAGEWGGEQSDAVASTRRDTAPGQHGGARMPMQAARGSRSILDEWDVHEWGDDIDDGVISTRRDESYGQRGANQRSTVSAASSKAIMEDWDTVGRCGDEHGEALASAWHGEVPGQAGSAQRSTVAAGSSKAIMEDWDTVGRCSDEHGQAGSAQGPTVAAAQQPRKPIMKDWDTPAIMEDWNHGGDHGDEHGEALASAWHGEVPGQAGSAQRSTVAAASSKAIMEDWDTVGRCSDEHDEALASAWHEEVLGQAGSAQRSTVAAASSKAIMEDWDTVERCGDEHGEALASAWHGEVPGQAGSAQRSTVAAASSKAIMEDWDTVGTVNTASLPHKRQHGTAFACDDDNQKLSEDTSTHTSGSQWRDVRRQAGRRTGPADSSFVKSHPWADFVFEENNDAAADEGGDDAFGSKTRASSEMHNSAWHSMGPLMDHILHDCEVRKDVLEKEAPGEQCIRDEDMEDAHESEDDMPPMFDLVKHLGGDGNSPREDLA